MGRVWNKLSPLSCGSGVDAWSGFCVAATLALAVAAGCAPSNGSVPAATPMPDRTAESPDTGAATESSAGQCLMAGQDAWTTATKTVAVEGRATAGHGSGAACTFARQRASARAQQTCAVSYSNSSLYRNGRLVSFETGGCDCINAGEGRSCTASAEVQCEFETRAAVACTGAQSGSGTP